MRLIKGSFILISRFFYAIRSSFTSFHLIRLDDPDNEETSEITNIQEYYKQLNKFLEKLLTMQVYFLKIK